MAVSEDRGKEFIKVLLEMCERFYGLKVVIEAFNEFEIESEMEEKADTGTDQEEDDF